MNDYLIGAVWLFAVWCLGVIFIWAKGRRKRVRCCCNQGAIWRCDVHHRESAVVMKIR